MSEEAPWRNERLTKGEVYDILMQVAVDVEEMNKKHLGKKMTKLLKLYLVREIIEKAANSISKDHLERCGGWLGGPKGYTHPDCPIGNKGVHQPHYIEE